MKELIKEALNERVVELMQKHLIGKSYEDLKYPGIYATITNIEVGKESILIDLVAYLGIVTNYNSPLMRIKGYIYEDLKKFAVTHDQIIFDIDNTYFMQDYHSRGGK